MRSVLDTLLGVLPPGGRLVAIDGVEASLRMARLLRAEYPHAQVFARARDRRHAWQLMDLGARVFREFFGSSVDMGREVLVALGLAGAFAGAVQAWRRSLAAGRLEALARAVLAVVPDQGLRPQA